MFAIITHLIAVWGSNWAGQLYVPFAVGNIRSSNVKAIAGAMSHSLALKDDGTVWAWGDNQSGQLGDGTTNSSYVPIRVEHPTDPSGFLQGVIAISGNGHGSLALKTTAGAVWAWGSTPGPGSYVPIRVTDPSDPSGFLQGVQAIAGGTFHSLALKNDGTVRAWGDNQSGQLGDGTYTNSAVPVTVSGLNGVTAIAGGSSYSLAK